MTEENRPEVVLLTGGEPLIRPKLVRRIAEHGHEVGYRTQVLCGMFFARGIGQVPRLVEQAIRSVDHFSASLDMFHEREVGRADVFAALQRVREWGVEVSVQLTGHGRDDPYLVGLIDGVRETFEDLVPILVTSVSPLGRARSWLDDQAPSPSQGGVARMMAPIAPCTLASWPVVTFDGTIVTCCNQDVVDGFGAPHLVLGHTARDSWADARQRLLSSPILRAVRLYGPLYVRQQIVGEGVCGGYCESCVALGTSRAAATVKEHMARPTVALLEDQLSEMQLKVDPVRLMQMFGIREYAPLLRLGYKEEVPECAGS